MMDYEDAVRVRAAEVAMVGDRVQFTSNAYRNYSDHTVVDVKAPMVVVGFNPEEPQCILVNYANTGKPVVLREGSTDNGDLQREIFKYVEE